MPSVEVEGFPLARDLAHGAFELALGQRKSQVCFKKRGFGGTYFAAASAGRRRERCGLFELAIGHSRGFSSGLQDFLGHSDEALQLFDPVVGGFNLDLNFVLDFGEVELRF